jgi:predicted dehydrogenase
MAAIHPSIVACDAHLLHALRTGQPAAASGKDNLRTMQLVSVAYESAQAGHVITGERSH